MKVKNQLIEKECNISLENNRIVVSFIPQDTIDLDPGVYRYEAELITSWAMHYTFLQDQTFILTKELERRLESEMGSSHSGNEDSTSEIDGELNDDNVVDGDLQPTNPSLDYDVLENKPRLNGIIIKGNHDNVYYGIPTELADLTADADHRTVSDTEKETWNAKSDFSGSYNDLTDVPEDLVEDAEYVHTDNNYTSAEKTKLGDIESGAEVNVQADWNETDTSSDAYIQNKPTIPAAQVNSDWNASSGVAEILHKPTLGTAAAKNYTGSVLENSTDLVESGAVKTAIDSAVSSVYKPSGNKTCAELVSGLLIASNLGNVYNMTDDGVTTADFVEGAGKPIEAGDNVVIVDVGSSTYKFDLLSGMIDLSNYVQKSSTAGLIKNDGTIDPTAYAKQNEMSVSTNGDQTTIQLKNGMTATVINAHQDISGKVDKEQGKGLSTNDYTTAEKEKLEAISTEANKVTASETNGNIQIDGTEATVYDDTELQGAVSDLEDDVEEIQGEITTETATIEGNPLNFSTKSAQNAKSTIVSVEPIQDLHGYSKPWVGGAGKNKLPMTVDGIKSSNTGGTWSGNVYTWRGVTYTIITDSDNNVIGISSNGIATGGAANFAIANNIGIEAGIDYVLSGCPSGGVTNTYALAIQNANGDWIGADYDTGTGSTINKGVKTITITVNNGTNVNDKIWYPMIRLSTESDATFAPYTNISSISGRTEVNLDGCGKNLLDFDTLTRKNPNSGQADNQWAYWNMLIPCVNNDTFTLNVRETNINVYATVIRIYDKDKNFIDNITKNYANVNNLTFTVNNSNAAYIMVSLYHSSSLASFGFENAQLELGSTATSYEPYTESNDITISLGQTVYGCQIKVEEGQMVVEKDIYLLGNLTWTYDSTWKRFVSQDLYALEYKDTARAQYLQSSDYEVLYHGEAISNTWNGKMYSGPSSNTGLMNLFVHDLRYTNTSDFLTAMGSSQVAYPLKDSYKTTINLTPNTIALLKGVNNISTTADGIKLTYRDGSVATLGDLKSAVDDLQDEIDNPIAYDGKTYRLGMDATGLYLYNITDDTKAYIQMVSE